MLLSEAQQEFDLSLAGVVSLATRRWYAGALRSLIKFLGDVEIAEISISDLRRWRACLLERRTRWKDHPTRPEEPGGLSVWSVHSHIRAVRRFFRWLVEEGLLETNPAARLELPHLPDEPPKAISEADLARMLETAKNSNPRDYAIVCFLADTGCRVGGLAGLRVEDVDLDRGRATVREKGQKARTVFFGERTRQALADWFAVRPEGKGESVFVGLRGGLTTSGVYLVLRRLAKAAGVTGRWNPHAFRHGWARGALQKGADISDVAHVLGHSDVSVTVRFYGRWSDEELKARHDRFSWLPDE